MLDTPRAAFARHALRQERTRLCVFSVILAAYAAAIAIGYRRTYPSVPERERFAAAFQDNLALRLFYGVPRDLASVGGYLEFRLVGLMSVMIAGWAVFAAVRALRAEEDAGRLELVLAGTITRGGAAGVAVLTLLAECVVMCLVALAALLAFATSTGDLSAGGAMLLAAAVVAPGALFAMVGALACQVAPNHRAAQALGGAAIGVSLLLRMVADLAHGAGWARWTTPFGWAELVHPVTGACPAMLLLFGGATMALALASVRLTGVRDVGTALVQSGRAPRSRSVLLGSPASLAVRFELPALAVGAGAFAFILGFFSKSIADEARRSGLGGGGLTSFVTTASSYLALSFVLFSLLVALYAASHVNGMRDEEASGRLETLLARPVGRWDG